MKEDYILQAVIWIQREKSNEYHNFWRDGSKPEQTGYGASDLPTK